MAYPVAACRGKILAAPAAWSPKNITGLVAWYDFSDATALFTDAGTTKVTASDDKIYQANDKSGNGYHLTQATEAKRPLWKTNQQNGLATAKGDGTQQFLSNATFWAFASSNYSWLGVWKAGTGVRSAFQFRNTTGVAPQSLYQYFNISGKERYNHKSDAGEEIAGGSWDIAASTTAYYLSSIIRNGTAFNRYINGGSANNQTVTIGATTTNLAYFFCQNGTGAFHDGYIAEFILYSAAISAADFTLLKTYLNTKWAVY